MSSKDNTLPINVVLGSGSLCTGQTRCWIWKHFLDCVHTSPRKLRYFVYGVCYSRKVYLYTDHFKSNMLLCKFFKNYMNVRVSLGQICSLLRVPPLIPKQHAFPFLKEPQILNLINTYNSFPIVPDVRWGGA